MADGLSHNEPEFPPDVKAALIRLRLEAETTTNPGRLAQALWALYSYVDGLERSQRGLKHLEGMTQ
jgi:hypothetical protein